MRLTLSPGGHMSTSPSRLTRFTVSAQERLKAAIVGEGVHVRFAVHWQSRIGQPGTGLARRYRAGHTDSGHTELWVDEIWNTDTLPFLIHQVTSGPSVLSLKSTSSWNASCLLPTSNPGNLPFRNDCSGACLCLPCLSSIVNSPAQGMVPIFIGCCGHLSHKSILK